MKNGLFQSPIYNLAYLLPSWWPILELTVMKMDADSFAMEEAEQLTFHLKHFRLDWKQRNCVTRPDRTDQFSSSRRFSVLLRAWIGDRGDCLLLFWRKVNDTNFPEPSGASIKLPVLSPSRQPHLSRCNHPRKDSYNQHVINRILQRN